MPRDYLMHQIESFAHALAKVLGLATLRQYDSAIETIDQTSGQLFRLDLQSVLSHSGESLAAHLRATYPAEDVRRKCHELATLLKEAGNIYQVRERDDESVRAYLTGLDLLLVSGIDSNGVTTPESLLVDDLAGALIGRDLPYETGMLLMGHYERAGRYASAEDMLFGLLENGSTDARLLESGIRFYERLQLQDDSSLAAGNLPREELRAGLAELRARSAQTGRGNRQEL